MTVDPNALAELEHCPVCGRRWSEPPIGEECGAMYPPSYADVVPLRCQLHRDHVDDSNTMHWHAPLWIGLPPMIWPITAVDSGKVPTFGRPADE